MSNAPIVLLYRNPWSKTLPNGVLLQILTTAGVNAAEKLAGMKEKGEIEADRDSFAAVLLDPTCPRSAQTLADRLLASIQIGPKAADYLPNAAAKADAHDRQQISNLDLVDLYSHCLGDRDFAWGESAEYDFAIGAGSGLKPDQDGAMVYGILEEVIDQVRSRRNAWLEEQRRRGKHVWYNPDNKPGGEYAAIVQMPALRPATSEV